MIPVILGIIFGLVVIVVIVWYTMRSMDKETGERMKEYQMMVEKVWLNQLKMLELDLRIANDKGYFERYEK